MVVMWRKPGRLAAGLVIAVVITGCGNTDDSTHAPSRAEYIRRADPVCAAAATAIKRVEHQTAANEHRGLEPEAEARADAPLARRAAAVLADTASKLSAIPQPRGDDATPEQVVRAARLGASAAGRLAGAADSDNESAISLIKREIEPAQRHARALARAYGFHQC